MSPPVAMFWVAYGCTIPFLAPLTVAMLSSAQTTRGMIFAVAAAVLLVTPPFMFFTRRSLENAQAQRPPSDSDLRRFELRLRWWPRIAIPFYVASVIVLVALVPSGRAPPESRFTSTYAGQETYPRWSLLALVPERDIMNLGWHIVPFIDPITPADRSREVHAATRAIYDEIDSQPGLRDIGHVLPFVFWGSGAGHYYAYVPKHRTGEKLPVLVFLHGSLGQFKSYIHTLRPLADEHGLIIITPTFGAGNWDLPGGTEAVDTAIAHAVRSLPIDPERMLLMGLSNGGLGVTRTFLDHPERYKGVAYLSSFIEPRLVRSQAFGAAAKGRTFFAVHGTKDRRCGLSDLKRASRIIEAHGAKMSIAILPDGDHFMFFTDRKKTLGHISRWITQSL